MRSFLIFAVGASVLVPSLPAQAREVRTLQPSSKWIVDYADESCRLARGFGREDQLVSLLIDQFYPGDSFRITLAGKVFGQYNLKIPFTALISFGPNEKPSETDGFAAVIGKTPAFIAGRTMRIAPYTDAEKKAYEEAIKANRIYDSSPIGSDREKSVQSVKVVNLLRSIDLVLETGPLDKAFDALRTCSWDTVRSWGLDIEVQKNRLRGPIPLQPLAGLLRTSDYPQKMVREGQQGLVNVRLIIDDAGQVESCVIQRSTKPKEFDDLVCRKLSERGRFEPALDASGKKIRSFFTQSVVFRIE